MCDGVRRGDFPAGTAESVGRKHFISANVKSENVCACVCVSFGVTTLPNLRAVSTSSCLFLCSGFLYFTDLLSDSSFVAVPGSMRELSR